MDNQEKRNFNVRFLLDYANGKSIFEICLMLFEKDLNKETKNKTLF